MKKNLLLMLLNRDVSSTVAIRGEPDMMLDSSIRSRLIHLRHWAALKKVHDLT
jgi:hypothetical protein